MALKLYTSVAKVLKLNVRKFWALFPTFAEVKVETLVGLRTINFSKLSQLSFEITKSTKCFYLKSLLVL